MLSAVAAVWSAVGLLSPGWWSAQAVPGAAAQEKPRQVPAFRTGVEIVSLTVTATTPDGRYVTDLEPEEFQVYEDGVKQDVAFFNRSNQPIALALLLDTSASMEDKMPIVHQAAVNFVERLRKQDVASIIDFNSRVEIVDFDPSPEGVQVFTNDVGKLTAAIRATSAGGSTALHNAIYISLKELKKIQGQVANPEQIRRQAIVVLSDGEDTSSLVGFDEVLDLAKRSETAIHTIGLKSREYTSQRGGFNEADYVLRTLAHETGGRAFFPNRIEDLNGVYERIAEELGNQYLVGYASKNTRRDGTWRRIVVRVSRPNVTPRTKQGYYAPTGS